MKETRNKKPKNYWTLKKIQKEALKYKTRSEFYKKSTAAYSAARKLKILNTVCSHMIFAYSPWTIEKIHKEALKYKTRSEFCKNSKTAYCHALQYRIMDSVCSHMELQQKPNNYWTFEKIQEEALKYKTRGEFYRKSPAYQRAIKQGIIDQVCKHMDLVHNQWTIEKIQREANKYTTRNDFRKNSSKAYAAAKNKKMIDLVCAHMKLVQIKWTSELIQAEALKYNTRNEFYEKSSLAYDAARNRGILDNVCSHMILMHNKWTVENIKIEALKYKTRLEFQKNSLAYSAAMRQGILDQVCSHMKYTGNTSTPEKDLFNTIKKTFPKTQKLIDRKVNIKNKPQIKGFDVDVYIPELRKGIEFDGKYWHGEGFKRNWTEDPEEYHKIKDEYFRSKGIEILHIKEEEWLENKGQCIDKCFLFLNGENN